MLKLKTMCTRPLKFWRSDKPDENGVCNGFITDYSVDTVKYDEFVKHGIPCHPSYELHDTLSHRESIDVPCGKCLECHADKARLWTFRLLAENEFHKYAYFITITYDDNHLPSDRLVHKEDIQEFIKSYRRTVSKMRYFVVGEYGDISNRPHYHLIAFTDEPIPDLKLVSNSKYPVYESTKLDNCWKSKGGIRIGLGNGKSFAYTCGYIQKKTKKQGFILMSKRPGIGYEFFEKKITQDTFYIGNGCGQSLRIHLPKFLKDKYGVRSHIPNEIRESTLANKLHVNGFGFSKMELENYRDFIESIESQPLTKKV